MPARCGSSRRVLGMLLVLPCLSRAMHATCSISARAQQLGPNSCTCVGLLAASCSSWHAQHTLAAQQALGLCVCLGNFTAVVPLPVGPCVTKWVGPAGVQVPAYRHRLHQLEALH